MKTLLFVIGFLSLNALAETAIFKLRVSGESAVILSALNSERMKVVCESGECALTFQSEIEPNIELGLVEHPLSSLVPELKNTVHALRIHGGSQELQSKLYLELGKYTGTKNFSETLLERSVKLENKKLTLRCISSKDEHPLYECWIVASGELISNLSDFE